MENKLVKLTLKGFKSIAETELEFQQLNVLIGPNASGKSNLIAFFRMLNYMLSSPSGALQRYVGEQGGASVLLFDGAKRTHEIEAELVLTTSQGTNEYGFRLFYAASDILIFADERCRFSRGYARPQKWLNLGAGHREASLLDKTADTAQKTRATIAALLRGFIVYHFHDTSKEARVKSRQNIVDDRHLKYDAANLAPFLLRLRESYPKHYRRIVETVRQVVPFFDDFLLDPESGTVLLCWREQGSDVVFNASQASDGMLRAMAIITALLQPPEKLPALLIIDEPELGLHPYAITIIGGLIKAVAQHRQVLIATQSPLLLDQFDPEDVIVVERRDRQTIYRRLDEARLTEWLSEYTLSDLWHKNILGGRPREGQG